MRGGASGRGPRGGPGAIDTSGDAESVDSLLTARAAASLPAEFNFGWPWGNPLLNVSTGALGGNLSFTAASSTTSWAFPGPDRLFAIPQIIGRTRTLNYLAINRRSSAGTSDLNRILIGIYDGPGSYPTRRLWAGGMYLYPATPGLATVGGQQDIQNVSFLPVSPGLTLRSSRIYWLVTLWPDSLRTTTVAINGYHATQLQPALGSIFYANPSSVENQYSLQPNSYSLFNAAPLACFGWGVPWSHAAGLPETFPQRFPAGFVAGVGPDGTQNQYGQPNNHAVPVAMGTGGGTANVPAIWTAMS